MKDKNTSHQHHEGSDNGTGQYPQEDEFLSVLRAELQEQKVLNDALVQTNRSLSKKLKARESCLSQMSWRLGMMDNADMALGQLIRRVLRPGKSVSGTVGWIDGSPPDVGSPHVVVDAIHIRFGVSGGVEVYMKTLVQALLQHEGRARVTLACCEDQVKPLKELFADRVGYRVFSMGWAMRNALRLRNAILPGTMPIAAQTALISFARLEQEIGADIIHSPVQLFSSGDFLIPGVVNVHDLQHLHFPDFFHESEIEKRNRQYGEAVALADAVIASSEYVRGDIIAHMDVPPHKVHTIPVTWNPEVTEGLERFSVEQARKHYALPDTYAIFPAQFWLHKNHARLVEALAIVRDKAPGYDLNLVFTGNRKHHNGWPQVEKALREHKMHEHVRCLDYVPNEHLAALYKGSLFCVMPSLFEASSYPVIEAQVLGVPAMCSDVTSLPELMLYNAGLLFNPLDPEDIAEKMLRWLKDDEDRLAHARRGRERAVQEHSMDAYTSRLLALYQDIVSS